MKFLEKYRAISYAGRRKIAFLLAFAALAVVAADIFLAADGTENDTGRVIESYNNRGVKITLKEYTENSQAYYIADVKIRKISSLVCAFSNGEFESAASSAVLIMKDSSGLLGINSDFNWGTVIRNGVLLSDSNAETSMLLMYKSGKMKAVENASGLRGKKLLRRGIINTWAFGPILLKNGKIPVFDDDSRAPRTALGYKGRGHYIFLVADGRQQGRAVGLTFEDTARILKAHGCRLAYNLDGGASSQMLYGAEYINRPSGDNPRPLQDMIIIRDPEAAK